MDRIFSRNTQGSHHEQLDNATTYDLFLTSINNQFEAATTHQQACTALITTAESYADGTNSLALEDLVALQHDLFNLRQGQAALVEQVEETRKGVEDVRAAQCGELNELQVFVANATAQLSWVGKVLKRAEEKLNAVEVLVKRFEEELRK